MALQELGPSMDLKFVRAQHGDQDMLKEAMRTLRTGMKKIKNVEHDNVGDRRGRVHME